MVVRYIHLCLALVGSLFWVLTGCTSPSSEHVKDGDIIFHTSRSSQSQAIQLATKSPYSHMGIIFFRQGRPFVFEANATVRATPLEEWIQRGKDGQYVVKRLKRANEVLTASVLRKMKKIGQQFAGRPYDLVFGWSDDRIYCSELVWKIYHRGAGLELGQRQTLREFDLSAPAVQAKLEERYGSHIPLDEPVVSPAAMFDSFLLEEVKGPRRGIS